MAATKNSLFFPQIYSLSYQFPYLFTKKIMESGKYNLRTRAVPVLASRSVHIHPELPVSLEKDSVLGSVQRLGLLTAK